MTLETAAMHATYWSTRSIAREGWTQPVGCGSAGFVLAVEGSAIGDVKRDKPDV